MTSIRTMQNIVVDGTEVRPARNAHLLDAIAEATYLADINSGQVLLHHEAGVLMVSGYTSVEYLYRQALQQIKKNSGGRKAKKIKR